MRNCSLKEADAVNTSSSRLLIGLMFLATCSTIINISTLFGLIRHKRSTLFRYLLVMAVIDFVMCLFFAFNTSIKVVCETPTLPCYKFKATLIAWIRPMNAELILPTLTWSNIFIESYITVQRFLCICSISNNTLIRLKNASVWKVAVCCGLLAFSMHLHRFSSSTMTLNTQNANSSHLLASDFIRIKNSHGKTKLATFIMILVVIIKMLTMIIVLLVINIATIFKLKSYLKRNQVEERI